MTETLVGELNERVNALSETFATAFSGMVSSTQQSVSMMRNVNELLERYVISCVVCDVDVASAALTVRLSSRCQFALPNVSVDVELRATGDAPVALCGGAAAWLVESLGPSPARYERTFALEPALRRPSRKQVRLCCMCASARARSCARRSNHCLRRSLCGAAFRVRARATRCWLRLSSNCLYCDKCGVMLCLLLCF